MSELTFTVWEKYEGEAKAVAIEPGEAETPAEAAELLLEGLELRVRDSEGRLFACYLKRTQDVDIIKVREIQTTKPPPKRGGWEGLRCFCHNRRDSRHISI